MELSKSSKIQEVKLNDRIKFVDGRVMTVIDDLLNDNQPILLHKEFTFKERHLLTDRQVEDIKEHNLKLWRTL